MKNAKNTKFTNGKQRIATKEDCLASWSGYPNGANFRCAFCGYKLKSGDKWRWQYTNDIKNAGGNPIVCERCDKGPELTRLAWKEKCKTFFSKEWWWFRQLRNKYTL